MASYAAWARSQGKYIDTELKRWDNHMAKAFAALPIEAITVDMRVKHQEELQPVLGQQGILM